MIIFKVNINIEFGVISIEVKSKTIILVYMIKGKHVVDKRKEIN